VLDGQIKEHGRTRKAVEETIRICRDENVLKEYLERQWEEVLNMYDLLFNQETIMENHVASETRKAEAKGREAGRKEDRKEGRKEGRKEATDLINYLWSHGRGEEAMKASSDDSFFQKLMAEFTGMTPAK
jgi:hypothetical protein